MPNDIDIEGIKNKYPSETKVKLEKAIDDVPIGTIGEVDVVDEQGNIHVNFENGSRLTLNENTDHFQIISVPDKIKVIVAEPNKEPCVKEIYNSLRAKQKLVGGLIQCVPSFFDSKDTYDFMVNEEGKKDDLPPNRYIFDKQDIVCGNLVLIKADNNSGEFISLEDHEIEPLIEKINNKCPMYEEPTLYHEEIEEMEEIEK